MAFCDKCGKKIDADSSFCEHCGVAVSRDQKQSGTKQGKKIDRTPNFSRIYLFYVVILFILPFVYFLGAEEEFDGSLVVGLAFFSLLVSTLPAYITYLIRRDAWGKIKSSKIMKVLIIIVQILLIIIFYGSFVIFILMVSDKYDRDIAWTMIIPIILAIAVNAFIKPHLRLVFMKPLNYLSVHFKNLFKKY